MKRENGNEKKMIKKGKEKMEIKKKMIKKWKEKIERKKMIKKM